MTISEAASSLPYADLCACVGTVAAYHLVHRGCDTSHERTLQDLTRGFPEIPWFDMAFGNFRLDTPFEGALYDLMRERCLPPSSMARILGVSGTWMRSLMRGEWYSDPGCETVRKLTQIDPGRDWISLAAVNCRKVHLTIPAISKDHPIRYQIADLIRSINDLK